MERVYQCQFRRYRLHDVVEHAIKYDQKPITIMSCDDTTFTVVLNSEQLETVRRFNPIILNQ